MNASGDAAEQVVRLGLEGFEVTARIAGASAKEVAIIIYTLLKNKKQSPGKTKLIEMLKSGEELKIFTVKNEDFQKFSEQAKKYGVQYCAINKSNKSADGNVDIIVKAKDASRINRIVDRFALSSYDDTAIRGAIQERKKQKETLNKDSKTPTKEKIAKQEAKEKPLKKESNSLNPRLVRTEKSPLSEHSSKTQKNLDQGTSVRSYKPSVKKKLEKYKAEVKVRDTKVNDVQITHQQPKPKEKKELSK